MIRSNNSNSRSSGQIWWKKSLANTILLSGSIVLALLAGEVFLRTMQPQELSNWSYTRDGLTLHLPNLTQRSLRFGHLIETNSAGMRDYDHSLEKPPGVYRILVLGDSFMEANQVKLEDAFVSVLKNRLRSSTGRAIEVVNASVSGWGTDDELTYLMREGVKYHPDLVLVAMTLHNDVSDNLLEEYHEFKNGKIEQRPVVVVPWLSYLSVSVKEWMASHSHLYQVFLRGIRVNVVSKEARNLQSHVAGLLRRDPEDRIQVGWKMTKELLRKMRQTADTINARVVIMLLPLSVQVYQETLPDFLASSNLKEVDIDLFKPQKMMQEIGMDIGVSIVDLFPVFHETKATCHCVLFVPNDGHWNKLGHQIAGEAGERGLLQLGLIEPALTSERSIR